MFVRVVMIVSSRSNIILPTSLYGTALKFIPGAGSLAGGMINGTVAAATTEMMGQTFIAYLDDNFSNLSEAIKNIGADALKKYASA